MREVDLLDLVLPTNIGTPFKTPPAFTKSFLVVRLLGCTLQDGSTGDDECYAMAAGSDGRLILAGKTDGSWGATGGNGDFVAIMLQTVYSPAPTLAPSGEELASYNSTMSIGIAFS